jgi:hypothetical protein
MVASTAVAHRIPAGWYRDKDNPSRRRWWDGIEWTNHYAPFTDSLTIDAPNTGEPTRAESTDPRMSALLDSIGSQVERAIAPQPLEQPEQSERHEIGSTVLSGEVEHAVHSSEIPITSMATTAPARRRVPLAVIVLLAGLTGANTVLLGILFSGR